MQLSPNLLGIRICAWLAPVPGEHIGMPHVRSDYLVQTPNLALTLAAV